MRIDGATYDPAHDGDRLTTQRERIFRCMLDYQWRTLDEIAAITHDPPASVSASLRDYRKYENGEHAVDRRSRGPRSHGLYEYRVIYNHLRYDSPEEALAVFCRK